MSKKIKLQTLKLKEKLEIIKSLEENGEKRKNICEKYKISPATVTRIVKHKFKLFQIVEENGSSINKKRIRKGHYEPIEEALNIWFSQLRSKGFCVSGNIIIEQAKKFAVQMKIDFEPNPGWLTRWKTKNNISFNKFHGEKGSSDEPTACDWTENILPNILKQYDENDVFNADESALFYKAMPDGTMFYKHEDRSGNKVQKNRITLLFMCNMTGTDKNVFAIGKFRKPHCFRNKEIPIKYFSNLKAWMTRDIWLQILKEFDIKLKKQQRKIVLVVDNASCHKVPDNIIFSNIRMVFLPANTTAIIQPLDQGIIRTFKVYYRQHIVRQQILALEKGMNIDQYCKSITILDVLRMVKRAWWLVKPTTIKNCFRKAKFVKLSKEELSLPTENEVEIIEDEIELPMNIQDEFNQFINIDSDEICYGDFNDTEIVSNVLSHKSDNQNQSIIQICEEDDEASSPSVSRCEALMCLTKLKHYMEDNNYKLSHIENIEMEFLKKIKPEVQELITKLFTKN